jgi:hypothetical protein
LIGRLAQTVWNLGRCLKVEQICTVQYCTTGPIHCVKGTLLINLSKSKRDDFVLKHSMFVVAVEKTITQRVFRTTPSILTQDSVPY